MSFQIESIYLIPGASLVAHTVKPLPAILETGVPSRGREDPLEKETATHSDTLAWKIPWMELQSMGSQRVRQDCVTSLSFFIYYLIPSLLNKKKKKLNYLTVQFQNIWNEEMIQNAWGGDEGEPV